MSSNRANHDDELLLMEMRALKPRVERLLDAIETRAEQEGSFKAEVRQTMSDVRYILRELRDGAGNKPSLLSTVADLEQWKKEQVAAEKERRREYLQRIATREQERRNIRTMWAVQIIGWIIAVALAIVGLVKH